MTKQLTAMAAACAALGLAAGGALAQVPEVRVNVSYVIVPQARAFPMHAAAVRPTVPRPAGIEITDVRVGVVILEQAATTAMEVSVRNRGGSRVEAELLVPVPDGAVVRGFTFQGTASEPTAQVLPKDEARRTYDAIVAKVRDPALLEFAGCNLIRSSVFPVEANGTQKVLLTYEHLLPADGRRIDYVLPRSESLDYNIPWQVSVKVQAKKPISTVYSPSHRLVTVRSSPTVVSAQIAADAAREPGAFRLSYLLEDDGVSASLFAYPDAKTGGGYFLLLAGLPAATPKTPDGPPIKREVTLVIDRSGSMNGEKIEQVREAALQVLAGLDDGEAFNLIVYNETIEPFATKPVIKNAETTANARAFIKALTARGGTNIHDALTEALRPRPTRGMLPIVLFLTDGLPTFGETREVAIREVATKSNPYQRRIFTFGVGVDVNTPLLDKIATETRATSTYVLPKEDVEVKVSQVFKRLSGPVLASPALAVLDGAGEPAVGRVLDVVPALVPDLFVGDQLVVLGRYVGEAPLNFNLAGNYLGSQRQFRFAFSLEKATTRNAFVPRLWASRKIAVLIDAIRQLGADVGQVAGQRAAPPSAKVKELVDEIVRLSTEFGILTEYTAFLAREGTDLSKRDTVIAQAQQNFEQRAMRTRSGLGAANQSVNNDAQFRQQDLNIRNRFYDERMNRVEISNVQQMNDRAFYNRNGRWVDSRIVEQEASVKPQRVIEFNSPEFRDLLARLIRENRAGTVSLNGDILMELDGQAVLVKKAATAAGGN
jgi:Ca-activated chloride channel family protein